MWDAGHIEALVTEIEAAAIQSAGKGQRRRDEETAARTFNAKVLNGSIRSAVRNLTSREGGGVVLPDDTCTKTGRPVLEVLRGKHPDLVVPVPGGAGSLAFEPYDSCPPPIPVLCDAAGMDTITRKIRGAAGRTASTRRLRGRC